MLAGAESLRAQSRMTYRIVQALVLCSEPFAPCLQEQRVQEEVSSNRSANLKDLPKVDKAPIAKLSLRFDVGANKVGCLIYPCSCHPV